MTKDLIKVPSAKRLMSSMRELGYEFADAVAEIVDNSIQANANVVQVKLHFDGIDSFLTILDNGTGMTPHQIREAMRFGSSSREYEKTDLGKFGLGLKTASLSQCDLLTVSSRNLEKIQRICSYSWDVKHISKVDRWEILPVDENHLLNNVVEHLYETTGTAITWEGLGRLMNFESPSGGRAENNIKKLIEELRISLGAIFHRYITGEERSKKIIIFVNDEKVEAWDPFSRDEKNTRELESFVIPVSLNGKKGQIKFRPFVLPSQKQFSSNSSHVRAGGVMKWNKQQGFYIYRAGRLLQSGGWCGLRTSDEHSKLARVMVNIPPGFDDMFKVNVSKMKINFPRELRAEVFAKLAPVLKIANDAYRKHEDTSLLDISVYSLEINSLIKVIENSLSSLDSRWELQNGTIKSVFPKLYARATPSERRALLRIFKRLSCDAEESS